MEVAHNRLGCYNGTLLGYFHCLDWMGLRSTLSPGFIRTFCLGFDEILVDNGYDVRRSVEALQQ